MIPPLFPLRAAKRKCPAVGMSILRVRRPCSYMPTALGPIFFPSIAQNIGRMQAKNVTEARIRNKKAPGRAESSACPGVNMYRISLQTGSPFWAASTYSGCHQLRPYQPRCPHRPCSICRWYPHTPHSRNDRFYPVPACFHNLRENMF